MLWSWNMINSFQLRGPYLPNNIYEPQSLPQLIFYEFALFIINVLNWALDEIYYIVESKNRVY